LTNQIYLDHAATTPVAPEVLEAMLPYFSEAYGNASSVHGFGRAAEDAMETAREQAASVLNCEPDEIVFTSCGSESDNLALRGVAWRSLREGKTPHIITTAVEHHAVLTTAEQLRDVFGCELTIVPVDRYGVVSPEAIRQAMQINTVLVSVMAANNEIGTIQPLKRIAEVTREAGVLLHTDAVQGAHQMSLDVKALSVDMLALSAHKFYGPKGVGLLYVRRGIELIPSQSGGGHERGRRAGTSNVAGMVGMARALTLAAERMEEDVRHYKEMRDALIEGILAAIPDAALSGHPTERLPNNASFVFEGVEGNALLMHLDAAGIAASSGSACKTGMPEPSEVLMAMGYNEAWALGGLRLTVGRQTTAQHVAYTLEVLPEAVRKLRHLSS
jgi:cysteine desulfurase